MPLSATQYFGPLAYDDDSVIEFPDGLPGFPEERRFVPVEMAEHRPLVFLQSLATPGLCFPALPVAAVDPSYRLELAPEELARLGFAAGARPAMGRELLCLAVVTIEESGITANLRAPVVVHLAARRAVQALANGAGYSHRHALEPAAEVAACS